MNNRVKIAFGLLAGGSLFFLALKKKTKKGKIFPAPDGNMYAENQTYITYDNRMYKNGQEIRLKTPESEVNHVITPKSYEVYNESFSKNYQLTGRNVKYHQKGIRHQ
ncbi:hypothetical protein [Chryseobacterium sp. OV279]|uniref:hypothetical protein n=1 Tax=Chryseobacterium sp. OV279 TaxID=1500285 RepID=UPI00091B1493|nr:hypothetical protein [Chryseobacterium sp. OV279]SHF80912.1 hypothetical protein SAMN02787100_2651 [Chryseobacterium sp. OV279]